MKKLGFLGKLMYWLNSIVALLLLISFILPYLRPTTFPTLSLLSLAVSPLLLLNMLFAVYWLIRLKKQFLLSAIVLVIAYFHFHPFLEISSEGDASEFKKTLSVLTFNVRLFNAYEKDPAENEVAFNFSELLKDKNPDVVCIQEFYADYTPEMTGYPYQYIHFKKHNAKLGHAIFSKYPLIGKGAFNFQDTYNNAIYADAIVETDTVRIYNLHLQSLGILPSVGFLQNRGTEHIKNRISETFVKQEYQITQILAHKKQTHHPVIMAGDFNNTPFSYTYKELKNNMKDAFFERGNGLGTTYSFFSYPVRIDYVLVSNNLEVLKFDNIEGTFSDHRPVFAEMGW